MATGEPTTIISGADRATDSSIRTFETLDGLRGVAALAVMVWHLPSKPFLHSAYLAVDLFFILSGFVIAYRYEDRLTNQPNGSHFMVMRMIRLYPLYLLGSVIGAAWALIKLTVRHGGPARVLDWIKHVVLAVAMLPNMLTHGLVYPFNIPAWSLFYEVLVNAIYGFTARRTSNSALGVIILLSAAALAWAVLAYGNMRFTVRMPEFLIGGFRALFGFYVGIALFRLREHGRLPTWRMPPLLIIFMLLLCLAIPRDGPIAPWLTMTVVFVAFPLLTIFALANEPSGFVARLFAQLGLLSFPVYAIHRPILMIVEYFGRVLHAPHMVTAGLAIAISLVLAWLALEFYDKPVRHWLTQLSKRKTAQPAR